MLKACGLHFSVEPSGVDEEALSTQLQGLSPGELAVALAQAKASAVSKNHPQAYVIGADQICCLDGTIFSKPGTLENAEKQLRALAGRKHQQHCGAVILHNGKLVWQKAQEATLTMRPLSHDSIRAYLTEDKPLSSCGSYKFESLGRHLFSAADGDHDVIKGLPLLPLLNALHELGVISLAT